MICPNSNSYFPRSNISTCVLNSIFVLLLIPYDFRQSEIPLSFNGFYRVAVAVQHQRVIYTDYSGFASPALGRHISTFRGYRILFSIRNPYINRFTNHFFYSFITILPSESGVTLHYSTILPQILLFRHLTSIFESTNVISRY